MLSDKTIQVCDLCLFRALCADLWIVYLIQRIYCLAWEMTGPRSFNFYPDVLFL